MLRPHTFLVGASPDCDIVLHHQSVSGRHARLEVQGKGWRIVDLGSTNGLSVGGERVQSADVAEASPIAFGSHAMRLGAILAQANPPQPADGESWTVGSSAQCDVHVDFPRISPEHARIRNSGGRLWLSNVPSSGGTRTQGGPVQSEVQVRLDDQLWLGSLGLSVSEVLWWRDARQAPSRQMSTPPPPPPTEPVRRPALATAPAEVVQNRPWSQGQRPVHTQLPQPVSPKSPPSTFGRNLFALLVLAGVLYVVFPQLRRSPVLPSAIREPQVMVNESVVLKEGNAKLYSFSLPTDREVTVEVTASPKVVDVMLMTAADRQKYEEAMGSLFDRGFTYRQKLSSKGVLRFSETDTVPAGTWTIVVQRPNESALLGDDTAATVKVTVQ